MIITIVIPCYNEQEILLWSIQQLRPIRDRIRQELNTETRILLVDDGSKDTTWNIIQDLSQKENDIQGIRLAHNVGHQQALWAGMETAVAYSDAIVSIDADLQDDEEKIFDMAKMIVRDECDIVYGIRQKRDTDTFFKRSTANLYYKLLKTTDKEIIDNHADFRMLNRKALLALLAYPERNTFIRGLVRLIGFREGRVYYDRKARTAGETKYPLKKMIALSVDGITSFSTAPIKFITYLGLIMILFSFCSIIYALAAYVEHQTIPGWTSILISIWIVGGILTTSLGVIGIYIAKIYHETKRRPRYCIMQEVNLPQTTQRQ